MGVIKCLFDRDQHGISLSQNVMIPESNDVKPLCPEPGCAFLISDESFCMLSAINLNNEFLVKANEIRNVWADRRLASKPGAFQLSIS